MRSGLMANMARLFKEHYILLPVLTYCLVLIGIENWQRLRYACMHAIDFSIYQQAMYDFFAQKTLNPWLTIRNIAFFNDHFDPIVLLAGLLINIWPSPESMIVFEYSFLILSVIAII